MKKTSQKIMAFLTIFVLLAAPAGAVQPSAVALSELEIQPVFALEPAEETTLATKHGLPLADLPETMRPEQAEDAGLIERLHSEELDPNTAVFRTADGQNALFIFSEDIWYKDEQGQKIDYSTQLEAADASTGAVYTAQKAAGQLLLPGTLDSATPIRYNEDVLDISIYPTTDRIIFSESEQLTDADGGQKPATRALTPLAEPEQEIADSGKERIESGPGQVEFEREAAGYAPVTQKQIESITSDPNETAITRANAAAAAAAGRTIGSASLVSANDLAVRDRRSVEYFRANRDANVVTTPLLHGVKNDLIISSYNGNNIYAFAVELDSALTPTESTGDSIALLDIAGELRAYINIEPLTDAHGNRSMTSRIDIAPYDEAGKYLVMVTLDEAFLKDPGTSYPLRAPVYVSIGAAYINDTDVSQANAGTNYASSASLYVGRLNGYTYRTYFQFIIGSYLTTIAPDNITSAYLILYEYSGNTSSFTMQPRIPGNTWNYNTLTWNNQPSLLTAYNGVSAPANVSMSMSITIYNVYMTAFIQACMRNYVNNQLPVTIHELRGLALKGSDESSSTKLRYFQSTNAGTSSIKPTLVIYYEPQAAVSSVSVSPSSASVNAGSTRQLTATVSPANAHQSVTWSTTNGPIASANYAGLVSANSPGKVTITATSTANTSKSGTSTITVDPVSTSYTTISSGGAYGSSLTAGQHRWYKITPTASGTYYFLTTGSTDTYGELWSFQLCGG